MQHIHLRHVINEQVRFRASHWGIFSGKMRKLGFETRTFCRGVGTPSTLPDDITLDAGLILKSGCKTSNWYWIHYKPRTSHAKSMYVKKHASHVEKLGLITAHRPANHTLICSVLELITREFLMDLCERKTSQNALLMPASGYWQVGPGNNVTND